MADVETMLKAVQGQSEQIHAQLTDLLGKYEDLHRESSNLLTTERMKTSPAEMHELDNMYFMVMCVRRNRDIVGSMLRGVGSLRSLSEFKVVEEDVPETKTKAPAKAGTKAAKPTRARSPKGPSTKGSAGPRRKTAKKNQALPPPEPVIPVETIELPDIMEIDNG